MSLFIAENCNVFLDPIISTISPDIRVNRAVSQLKILFQEVKHKLRICLDQLIKDGVIKQEMKRKLLVRIKL